MGNYFLDTQYECHGSDRFLNNICVAKVNTLQYKSYSYVKIPTEH